MNYPALKQAPEFTVFDISPLQDPLVVPAAALEVFSQRSPFASANVLIEQAITLGDPTYLEAAEAFLADARTEPAHELKVRMFEVYVPAFEQIATGLAPDKAVIDAVGTGLLQIMVDELELLKLSPKKIQAKFGNCSEQQAAQIMGDRQGDIGEVMTARLSAHNASGNWGDLAIPSSRREESSFEEVHKALGVHNHDFHTHNPDNPNDRSRFGVKTTLGSQKQTGSSPEFRILAQATLSQAAAYDIDPTELSGRVTPRRLLEVLISAENPTYYNDIDVATRDYLADKLQDIIEMGWSTPDEVLAARELKLQTQRDLAE